MKYFISLNSTKLLDHEYTLLRQKNIEGVVLYGRNVLSLATTRELICSIKSINPGLKIAIDEEGGIVSRIIHLFPSLSQLYCATLPLPYVREAYKKRSQFLKNLGIDLNFAPVVDIALNESSYIYKRSFGSNPDKIIEMAKICIDEQKNAGILSCLKHFPGHGRSKVDSHQKLPVVNTTKLEWDSLEGKIFKELVNFGVDCVMIGHLLFPQINPNIASISTYWINEILRNKLGFKGLVVTDDICMKGLTNTCLVNNNKIFEEASVDLVIITEQNHILLSPI